MRAADVSVNHPHVVEHYRAAHSIAVRNSRGDADTEQLRQALVHFRALFEDLLEYEAAAGDGRPADERHADTDERSADERYAEERHAHREARR